MEINFKGHTILIDAEDLPVLDNNKWCVNKIKGKNNVYYYLRSERKGLFHRFIMGVVSGSKLCVDHINHNTLDNRKCNLRIATMSQNQANQPARKAKVNSIRTSKYKGVTKIKDDRYAAQIFYNRTAHYLGLFDNEIDAAKAYNKAALSVHGEFAYLNDVSNYGDL